MSTSLSQYLDMALEKLDNLGLLPAKIEEAPITSLISKAAEVDQEKLALIAKALSRATLFNEVVREQVQEMKYGERYEALAAMFDSIRKDAKAMVDQVEDGKIDTFERIAILWMKTTRGDIPYRFNKIKDTYLEVAADTKDQIDRETLILEAYKDFRGALKQAEVMAFEVLEIAEQRLVKAQNHLSEANKVVEDYKGDDPAEKARLELARDEKLRALQDEDARYQIVKDLSDNLTVGYNTTEVVMARLTQTTSAKKRVYAQSVSFFATNETVLTALSASFTGLHGLHESTQTLNKMKEGVNQSLETLAEIGNKVQEEALKAGYGPTVKAKSVEILVNAVVQYQEKSRSIISEMRELSTNNAKEISNIVEDGKKRMADLARNDVHRTSSIAA